MRRVALVVVVMWGLLASTGAAAAPIATYNKTTIVDTGLVETLYGQNLSYTGDSGTIGYFDANATYNNQIGFPLSATANVESFSIEQLVHSNRYRFNDITVYYGVGQSRSFSLADSQAVQTLTFPSPVTTDYLHIAFETFHTAGSTDFRIGVDEVIVNGTTLSPRPNLNLAPGVTASGTNFAFAAISVVIDNEVCAVQSNAPYWREGSSDPDTLRVDYPQAQTVGEIALALGLDIAGRVQAKSFTLNYTGGSEVFSLAEGMQYTRFTLSAPVTTTFLQVVFPTGAANYYPGGDQYFGATEFQAFAALATAASPVPEPAGLGLVGLAMLALRRRRG